MTTPIRNPEAVSNVANSPLGQYGRLSAHTRQGVWHAVNQDQLGWGPGFIGITDGVGSGAMPELASLILLEGLRALHHPDPDSLASALIAADLGISAALKQRGVGAGASVFAAAWISKDADGSRPVQIQAAHVGDCKILHLRPSSAEHWDLIWQTQDQSYAQMGLVPPEGISETSPANMVGCGMSAPAAWHSFFMRPGDRLMLCSDGALPLLNPTDLSQWMQNFPAPLHPLAAKIGCDQAMALGNQDDVSVLLLEYSAVSELSRNDRPWWRRWGSA